MPANALRVGPVSHRKVRKWGAKRAKLAALALPALLGGTLSAQTVLNATDEATLRAHINTANASTGDFVINLAAGTYSLTGANGENANVSGDLDITKNSGRLVLRGAGTGSTSLVNGGNDRLIHILGDATVVIEAMLLADGQAFDDGQNAPSNGLALGGGILKSSTGGSLSLNDVSISSCNASGFAPSSSSTPAGDGGDARGGGIYVAGGTVTLNRVEFFGCQANGGNGTFDLSSSTVNSGDAATAATPKAAPFTSPAAR